MKAGSPLLRGGGITRLFFAVLVVGVTYTGYEFPPNGEPNFWYAQSLFGLPLHYPAMAGLILLALPMVFASPRVSIVGRLKSMRLWVGVVLVWIALIVAIGYGITSGAPELFADWRNIALAGVMVVLAGRWLAGQRWRREVTGDLAIGYGAAGLVSVGWWLAGGGADVFGETVPVFYYPQLFMLSFSSLVCLSMWLAGLEKQTPFRSWAIRVAALASTFTVLVSFRRAFWVAWVCSFVLLLIVGWRRAGVSPRRVLVILGALAFVVAVVVARVGTSDLSDRIASIAPSAQNEFSSTNQDHINDVLDALSIVAEKPITGLGIGRLYRTPSISEWKDRSFEVHNAAVHVWLKYGLLGLLAYAWLHIAWIRYQFSTIRDSAIDLAADLALGAYLVAIVVNTMVQTWVYGSFQMSIHLGVVMGVVIAASGPEPRSGPRLARAKSSERTSP